LGVWVGKRNFDHSGQNTLRVKKKELHRRTRENGEKEKPPGWFLKKGAPARIFRERRKEKWKGGKGVSADGGRTQEGGEV